MYNVTEHDKVPKHEIMNIEDKDIFMKSIDIKSESQLPVIKKISSER